MARQGGDERLKQVVVVRPPARVPVVALTPTAEPMFLGRPRRRWPGVARRFGRWRHGRAGRGPPGCWWDEVCVVRCGAGELGEGLGVAETLTGRATRGTLGSKPGRSPRAAFGLLRSPNPRESARRVRGLSVSSRDERALRSQRPAIQSLDPSDSSALTTPPAPAQKDPG